MPFFRLGKKVLDDAEVSDYDFDLSSQYIEVSFKNKIKTYVIYADLAGSDWLTVLETQLAIPAPQRHPRS